MTKYAINTLVVTSAIQPPENMPYLRLADPRHRLLQTYCSLICWIREPVIQNIVLCDNSGVYEEFTEIASLAKQYNKSLEVLTFRGNKEQTYLRGKGYGEGEIMKYAMEHSRLLGDDTTFYKITGRLFVEGFNALHNNYADKCIVFTLQPHYSKYMNVLLRRIGKNACISYCRHHIGISYADTRFYKCTKQYYKQNLMEQFLQVDDRHGFHLEHAFLISLLENKFDTFTKTPYFVGYSATSNRLYRNVDYSNEVKDLAERLLKK